MQPNVQHTEDSGQEEGIVKYACAYAFFDHVLMVILAYGPTRICRLATWSGTMLLASRWTPHIVPYRSSCLIAYD
jgi:hypothetical protein